MSGVGGSDQINEGDCTDRLTIAVGTKYSVIPFLIKICFNILSYIINLLSINYQYQCSNIHLLTVFFRLLPKTHLFILVNSNFLSINYS